MSKDSAKEEYTIDSEYDDEEDLLTEQSETKGDKKQQKRSLKKRQYKLIEIQFPTNMIKA